MSNKCDIEEKVGNGAKGWDPGSILSIDFDQDDRMVEVKPDACENEMEMGVKYI